MLKYVLPFLLLPLLSQAQLKEFEAESLQRNENVIQGNRDFPDNVLIIVYSSLDNLQFRSSLDVINKQSYNAQLSRYEILAEPRKQMINVSAPGFMQLLIATINPNPKDVLYYKVEEKKHRVVSTEPGTLKITTEPSGADIFMNGMRMADKAPFTGELNPGGTRIKLQKPKHETLDTLIAIRGGETTMLSVQLRPTTLWVNISSTPSGADVTLDGISQGKTPASFELDLTDASKRGSKPLRLTLSDHETISASVDLQPSATPLDVKHTLTKQKGSFSITSTPDGTQVFIGGQLKGTTPLQGSLEVGQYEVELKLQGYTATKQILKVHSSTASQLNFALSKRTSNICVDPAGRKYKTVKIGDQLWMAENLAYRPQVGNYWAYNNDPKNVKKYGYLYDWETAKKVCPAGWHLPSDAEWTRLTDYLGGKEVAGSKMKSRAGWRDNGNGTDESGFSGLPSGSHLKGGTFHDIHSNGYWWSCTSYNDKQDAWYRGLGYNYSDASRNNYSNGSGFSVRCLGD
jgi:uncharacterized protein (TIGR02145 family)